MIVFASTIVMCAYYAAVILSLAFIILQKKRRILYLLPSYCLRLLALPNQSRTATVETHASICNQCLRRYSYRNITPKA